MNYRSKENIISFVNTAFLNLNNYEYYAQETISKGGYVEVIEDEKLDEDEKFEGIASKIAELLKQGVNSNDISILTYTNDDVLSLYGYLKEKFPSLKISTEMTSKLINQQNVKAVINAIKYLYFKEEIYKENLNAIVGNDLLTRFDFEITFQKKSMQEVIKELATYLKLIDENIIKFIDECRVYKNIVDFVYEIDKLESTIENSELTGLQILTIFKSKGLEFHTVILLDRIKKKTPDRSTLLFEYDDINLKNIYYKIKGFENYNLDYASALKKEKSLVLDDELNILYVALTRAKNNMIIFKKQKASVFEYLQLNEQKIGEIVISENLSKNYEKTQKVEYIPLNLGVQDKQIKSSRDLEEDILHSKYFGLATHYCLEMINEFDLENLDYVIDLAKSRYSNYLDVNDFVDIKSRIKMLIENDKFISIINNSEFISEQSLIYKEEIKIIDLLLYKDDSYYIIDYKTTKEKLGEHVSQVSYYKKAIKDIFKTSNVYSYLVYLQENEISIDEVK